MAKKNRRINVAKREANALREELQRERDLGRVQAQNFQHSLTKAHAARQSAEVQLHDITEKLRQLCLHTCVLPAEGKVGPSDYLYPEPPPFGSYKASMHWDIMQARRPIELIHLLMHIRGDEGFGDHRRYVHFRVKDLHGRNRNGDMNYAQAISREVLMMMRNPDFAAREICEAFGGALSRELSKETA